MSKQNITIGKKIKALRIKKEMSIEDVSKKTGISEDVILEIEENKVSPPLGNIVSLADVLRVTVGELFGDSADSPFCIVRSDNRKAVSRFSSVVGKSSGYSYESLGHRKQNRQMEPFLVTLTPAENFKLEPNQHVGEEIIFVLEGQVEVRLADHTDILNPGDSIYYDSTLPHIVSCHGNDPATIFAVIYAKKEMLIL
ncbi:MAG: cupin domain-containing protein [Desulfuromonadales bacterium]|jgi:transcriptional regulator with XRE-family HTH domain|nr:cupin domain-containing protein [Desulfuromonadales bacterium]MDH3960851.1 cupin domain-containing protein [Desulfuromonadales bacterium]MDH4026795.1 cupin domain-containing protein [Desulfuromonadales bacterium]